MASELRVNTLKDASGNNSVATSVVFNGTCKIWVNFDGTAGTLAARDSYNIAGFTDVGTGNYTASFTSNMNNDDYSGVVSGASDNYEHSSLNSEALCTTSSIRFFMFLNASDAASDNTIVSCQIQGDLA
jgi:hypothetical protein